MKVFFTIKGLAIVASFSAFMGAYAMGAVILALR